MSRNKVNWVHKAFRAAPHCCAVVPGQTLTTGTILWYTSGDKNQVEFECCVCQPFGTHFTVVSVLPLSISDHYQIEAILPSYAVLLEADTTI